MSKKDTDFIKKFNENRKIISQFLVIEKNLKKSQNNRFYLDLLLQDKTGQITAKMFNNKVHSEFDKIEINSVYNIVGKIQEFPVNSNKFNILIDRIVPAKKYDEDDFIIKIKNQEKHVQYLMGTISEIEDDELKLVLNTLFKNEDFFNKFINAPAAKKHHHNFKGGLLVHTNEVVEICKGIADIYENINRDLLITGAIVHDIGKIETYEYSTELIDISYEGKMLEHIFVGACILKETMNNLKISDKTKIDLIHLVLSHHGKVELGWGSCVNPNLPEAVALHHADDMSAKITKSLKI